MFLSFERYQLLIIYEPYYILTNDRTHLYTIDSCFFDLLALNLDTITSSHYISILDTLQVLIYQQISIIILYLIIYEEL